MQVQPYLSFEGRCEEAINFYKSALGAKVAMMMRFKEAPDQSMMTPGTGDKVLHASLQIGDSTVMAFSTDNAWGRRSSRVLLCR